MEKLKNIKVLVPIATGTEEMEAVGVIDLLRRAGIDVTVAGNTDLIECSRGVILKVDKLLQKVDETDEFDAIILPGGLKGTENLSNDSRIKVMLDRAKQNGKLLGAICAAPTILAKHELIEENSSITSHPGMKNQLSRYRYSEEKVVLQDNIITSRGVGTVIDFALALIEYLIDRETAERVSKEIVYHNY